MKKILLIIAILVYLISVPIFLFFDQYSEELSKQGIKLLSINDVYISFKGAKYLLKSYNDSSSDVYNIVIDTIYSNGKYEQTKQKIFYENRFVKKTLYTLSELIQYNSSFSVVMLTVFFMYVHYKILFISNVKEKFISGIYYFLVYTQIVSMLLIHFFIRDIHIFALILLLTTTVLNEILIILYIEDYDQKLIKTLTKVFLLIIIVICFITFICYQNDFKSVFEYIGFLLILVIGLLD